MTFFSQKYARYRDQRADRILQYIINILEKDPIFNLSLSRVFKNTQEKKKTPIHSNLTLESLLVTHFLLNKSKTNWNVAFGCVKRHANVTRFYLLRCESLTYTYSYTRVWKRYSVNRFKHQLTFIIERAPSDRGDENVTALLGHYDATDQASQPTNRPTSQPNDHQPTDGRTGS